MNQDQAAAILHARQLTKLDGDHTSVPELWGLLFGHAAVAGTYDQRLKAFRYELRVLSNDTICFHRLHPNSDVEHCDSLELGRLRNSRWAVLQNLFWAFHHHHNQAPSSCPTPASFFDWIGGFAWFDLETTAAIDTFGLRLLDPGSREKAFERLSGSKHVQCCAQFFRTSAAVGVQTHHPYPCHCPLPSLRPAPLTPLRVASATDDSRQATPATTASGGGSPSSEHNSRPTRGLPSRQTPHTSYSITISQPQPPTPQGNLACPTLPIALDFSALEVPGSDRDTQLEKEEENHTFSNLNSPSIAQETQAPFDLIDPAPLEAHSSGHYHQHEEPQQDRETHVLAGALEDAPLPPPNPSVVVADDPHPPMQTEALNAMIPVPAPLILPVPAAEPLNPGADHDAPTQNPLKYRWHPSDRVKLVDYLRRSRMPFYVYRYVDFGRNSIVLPWARNATTEKYLGISDFLNKVLTYAHQQPPLVIMAWDANGVPVLCRSRSDRAIYGHLFHYTILLAV